VFVDCVVTHWNEWSKQDNKGIVTRWRFVVVSPMHGGKACPPLQETKTSKPYNSRIVGKLLICWFLIRQDNDRFRVRSINCETIVSVTDHRFK